MAKTPIDAAKQRLDQLLKFLETDPNNLALLSDAAETALAAQAPDEAASLLERHRAIAPLPARLLNILGLASLQAGAYENAIAAFQTLRMDRPEDAALRFNLAWSLAMTKNLDDALELLDEAALTALPQAAALFVELLHDRGDFDKALEAGKRLLELHPRHSGLNAAISVLAIDMEDFALAEACARNAPGNANAETTLGILALDADQATDAKTLFEQALRTQPQLPRAWIGKGLAALALGQTDAAAADIERGARMFGDHLGSWIAAGWAHLLADRPTEAEQCFSRALAIDGAFSEAHGSLAVIALRDDRPDDARRLAQTALRLDPHSFSGALAQALLLESKNRSDIAQKILERALHAPLDASGRTLAQALARRGLSI